MLILKANVDDLELVTSATGTIHVHLSAMKADASTPPVVQPVPDLGPAAAISTATTTQILDTNAMTNGHVVNVKDISIRNAHASTSNTVTLQVNDGTNTSTIMKAVLLAGETLKMTQGGVWIHYDANGGVYPSIGNAATQAEMEAGTATDKYVTPQGVNWHPGAIKAWGMSAVSAGVPQMTATWNITSITDAATGRATPVIATDFSSVNYVVLANFECSTVTYNATTTGLILVIRNATQTVTQFTLDLMEIDIGQTTDPTAWHFACIGDQ